MRPGRRKHNARRRVPPVVLALIFPLLAACASTAPRAGGGSAESAARAPASIVVVRHAETAGDDPRDPSLSEAGQARAGALLLALRDLGIRAVYTSQYRRTRETGRVVAEGLNVPLVEVPITQPDIGSYSRGLLERIDREHPGGAALVVGHSNTAPVLVEVASARATDPIAETEYDRLYVLIRGGDGISLLRARYGDH